MRMRLLLVLVGGLMLGCNDHECAQDSECPGGKVCLESGGVFFGGRSCVELNQSDMSVADMSVDLTADTDTEGPCVGEVDRELCEASGATCGEIQVFDRCGASRTVACGLCRSIEACTDNACVCVPETNEEFCASQGKNCGMFEGQDRCGEAREVDCGTCEQGEACGEQSANVCGCPCEIDDVCYPIDSPNPNNACQSCQPDVDATAWSNRVGPCDDGALCTLQDSCEEGVCVGTPIQCPDAGQCLESVCSADNGLCESVPADEGGTCDDANLCTENDKCSAGACAGLSKRCASPGPCQISSCSMSTGDCVTQSLANGTSCSDGDSCTSNDTCQSGVCIGQQVKLCPVQKR